MPEVELTILKVGPAGSMPQGGSKYPVTVDEDIDYDITIYNDKGAEDLQGRKGQKVRMTLEAGKQFQGRDQMKVIKTPGWERGQGGGQGRGGWGGGPKPVEERAEAIVVAALGAAAMSPGLDTFEERANQMVDWAVTKAAQIGPLLKSSAPQANAQPQVNQEAWVAYIVALRAVYTLGKEQGRWSEDRGLTLNHDFVKPTCEKNRWTYPPTANSPADQLARLTAELEEYLVILSEGATGVTEEALASD